MNTKRFEDLEEWMNAKNVTVQIYKSTDSTMFKSDDGLRDWLRRAATSRVSNIAEGFERNGNKEFIQFLNLSKGSASEIRHNFLSSRIKIYN